jgi:predicted Zn-dependent protease
MGEDLDVNALAACVSAFYLGMDVACAPPISNEDLLKSVKSRPSRGYGKQLLTTPIHELLHRHARPDAFVIMGFTMFDLYPREEWNFVFGQAMSSKGTGVFSFARYRESCVSAAKFLRRCCMVLTHEIGHLFGFSHCVWYACCMNGSNHDAEADGRPMALCPVCLAKLREAIGPSCDLKQRDALLATFLEEAQLPELAEFHHSCGAVLASLPAPEARGRSAAPEPRGRSAAPDTRGRSLTRSGAGAKGGTGTGAPRGGSAVRTAAIVPAASGTSQARRASSRARAQAIVQRK